MKGDHPVLTLLGNNSGRNLGDAAILSSIIAEFRKVSPTAEFLVPSIAPHFIDHNYGETYNAKGVNIMPWTGSLRLLGFPTARALAKSDVALICDGIIFGRKLFSPHNFLTTLYALAPIARARRCALVCFLTGIGPFPSPLSRRMAASLMSRCDLLVMRDPDSIALAKSIGVTRPIEIAGDAAFMNFVSSSERGREVLREVGLEAGKPTLGLNITSYLDTWLEKGARMQHTAQSFVELYTRGLEDASRAIERENGPLQKVIFSCSPMDEEISRELASRTGAKVVDNSTYLSHDIQAAMRECGLMIGMRFHSIVLSSSVGVPVLGLVYAPKVGSYFKILGTEHLAVNLRDTDPGALGNAVASAWRDREDIRRVQQAVVEEQRSSARAVVARIAERYFTAESLAAEAPRAAGAR